MSLNIHLEHVTVDVLRWPEILNPYWQISGKWVRSYYWKTHPLKNHEYLFSFFEKLGREPDRITGKLIQKWMNFPAIRSSSWTDVLLNRYSWNLHGWVFQLIYEHPKIDISKIGWDFHKYGHCHAPEFVNYYFLPKCSVLDEFSRSY